MKVIVIYGSPNDKPFMEPAREYFARRMFLMKKPFCPPTATFRS